MRGKIHLVYLTEDSRHADRLRVHLDEENIVVSPLPIEQSKSSTLNRYLRTSISSHDYLVVLLSQYAVRSRWVHFELDNRVLEKIRQRSITIIPVKVRPCRTPSNMTFFRAINAAKNFDKGVAQLIMRLNLATLIDFDMIPPSLFEDLVFKVLLAYGFRDVRKSHYDIRDISYDLIAQRRGRDPFGRRENINWVVEIKSQKLKTDISSFRKFFHEVGRISQFRRALFVTNSQLTSAAREWLNSEMKDNELQYSILDRMDLRYLILAKPKQFEGFFSSGLGGNHV